MSERKLPSPVYAAAGAGEAVVEQLKKLPSKANELRDRSKFDERASELRETVTDNVKQGVETLKGLDGEKVRSAAMEAASTLGEKAREARSKAADTYSELVERGEHVVAGERGPIKVISTVAKEDAETGTAEKVAEAKTDAAQKAQPAKKPAAKKTTKKTTKSTKATKPKAAK
ncbi:MAG: hypothetical protein ACRD0P_11150 [Stackebrandtia sp.]